MSAYYVPPTKFADCPIEPKAEHIKFINVEDWTKQQWLDFRERGFGGSEIAAVCAAKSSYLRSYIHTDPIKIHCIKIGEPVLTFQGNRFSRFGHFHERNLQYLYQFWDTVNKGEEQMFANEENGELKNHVYAPKIYVTNDKYPHLFYSPDGFIQNYRGVGNFEAKNTSTMEARNYEDYVNPSFRMQVQQGLMITEHDYASIFIHLDGNNVMEVVEYPNKKMQDFILWASMEFLKNVYECVKIKEEYGIDEYYFKPLEGLTPRQREGVRLLQEREPTETGNDTEHEFIREMINAREEEVIRLMTEEEHNLAMRRKRMLNYQAKSKKIVNLIDNRLMRSISAEGHNKVVGDLQTNKPWVACKKAKNQTKPKLTTASDYHADKLQDI